MYHRSVCDSWGFGAAESLMFMDVSDLGNFCLCDQHLRPASASDIRWQSRWATCSPRLLLAVSPSFGTTALSLSPPMEQPGLLQSLLLVKLPFVGSSVRMFENTSPSQVLVWYQYIPCKIIYKIVSQRNPLPFLQEHIGEQILKSTYLWL